MLRLFDSHCHFDDPRFDDDRESVWERARSVGVVGAVVPATEPARWKNTLATALPGERWSALGIHPQCLPSLDERAVRDGLDALEATARANRPAVVAVGECGLDGTLPPDENPWERQLSVLGAQVEIARALDLPLVLHVLRAHPEMLGFLRGVKLPSRPGVIHSWSGAPAMVREYVAMGFYISIAGSVTRPNAKKPVESARLIPAERLLIETDAPDQIPSGTEREGRRCEPGDVLLTARVVAEARGMSLEALGALSEANARGLFALEAPA